MKSRQLIASVIALVAAAGAAYVGKVTEPAGLKMAAAAEKLVAGLTADQKAVALMGFDDPERTNWHFVPYQSKDRKPLRKGLPLAAMTGDQRDQVLALLRAGTGAYGYEAAATIMSLENTLKDLEKNGPMVRDPQWYFVSVFGTPATTGSWGWRFEGHHLSLNFTVADGRLVSFTPNFFGSNPAVIKDGPKKGQKTLDEVDELARELFRSLDASQRATALQPKQFPEIEEGKPAPAAGPAVGVESKAMTQPQQDLLRKLLTAYAARWPADVAKAELDKVMHEFGAIRFAYAGGTDPGTPHTYRVQGPTFIVEFLNVQADSAKNPANHIHSAWRNLSGDFGTKAK